MKLDDVCVKKRGTNLRRLTRVEQTQLGRAMPSSQQSRTALFSFMRTGYVPEYVKMHTCVKIREEK